jgi:hypothetical protein
MMEVMCNSFHIRIHGVSDAVQPVLDRIDKVMEDRFGSLTSG